MTTKPLGNGSTKLSLVSHTSKTLDPDPLDRAKERLDRAANATQLLEYSEDFDEPTGRTDVHVHMPQPSQPDIESVPERAADATRKVLDGVNSWQKVAALAILCGVLMFVAWLRWGR